MNQYDLDVIELGDRAANRLFYAWPIIYGDWRNAINTAARAKGILS